MTWRYILLDSSTMGVVAELPLISCRFGDVLNDRGSFSASMPLVLDNGLTIEDFDPPKAVFVAELSGVPVWAGFVWTWDMDIAGETFTINGEGFLSYFGHTIWATNYGWIGTEQANILADLVEYAQDFSLKPFAGINVDTTPSGGTGITRDRTFPAYEGKTVEDHMKSLTGSSIRNGLDFVLLPRWEGSPPILHHGLYIHPVPDYGHDSGIVLELGVNADLTGVTGDGTKKVTNVLAVGAGDEFKAPTAQASVPITSRRLEAAVREPDVSELGTLSDKAQYHADVYSRTIVVPTVTVDDSFFGAFIVGDQITVRGSYGLVDLNEVYRITAWEATMNDTQTSISLTLSPLRLFLGA